MVSLNLDLFPDIFCHTRKPSLLSPQVCEEWWAGRGLWGPRATASSARRSGCKPTREDRRKDKQINDQMDFLALLNVSCTYKS